MSDHPEKRLLNTNKKASHRFHGFGAADLFVERKLCKRAKFILRRPWISMQEWRPAVQLSGGILVARIKLKLKNIIHK